MSISKKRGFIRITDESELQKTNIWESPDYSDPNQPARETALNYDPSWTPSLPQEEEPEEFVLTEEIIEQIKQGAYNEGLTQGQEFGYKEGLEKGQTEGFDAGKPEGYQAGYDEGIAAGQSEIQERIQHLIEMADKFATPLELVDSQVEKQLIDMVLALTKEVIHVEVKTNPQVLLDTVRESVETLPVTEREITISLNSEDHQRVIEAYGEEALAQKRWTLVTEPSMNLGDINIQASDSKVSYLLEERIKTVLNKFCGVNRHQGNQ
ncbi:flagellar assembly protein FliH [Aliivibrio finisterrensis]|uniref:flagellar assembly protein FliH n=1 Tax=Aliivibrio finisterrensis TaxID=511998 RepID=UPI00101F2A1A|nr:flagellar assembly protein FliH [Aliivibrio finisterrensis]RYU69526.1 flagellar assembly protein FliH [Aliivibrio finisterrensis]RYU73324.1 flagellar assembly protein FliH [Aliivibrio finisterrensis]RYU76278.1 flagellar assembly protein FliH [Aliivibrio finisterrensis]